MLIKNKKNITKCEIFLGNIRFILLEVITKHYISFVHALFND